MSDQGIDTQLGSEARQALEMRGGITFTNAQWREILQGLQITFSKRNGPSTEERKHLAELQKLARRAQVTIGKFDKGSLQPTQYGRDEWANSVAAIGAALDSFLDHEYDLQSAKQGKRYTRSHERGLSVIKRTFRIAANRTNAGPSNIREFFRALLEQLDPLARAELLRGRSSDSLLDHFDNDERLRVHIADLRAISWNYQSRELEDYIFHNLREGDVLTSLVRSDDKQHSNWMVGITRASGKQISGCFDTLYDDPINLLFGYISKERGKITERMFSPEPGLPSQLCSKWVLRDILCFENTMSHYKRFVAEQPVAAGDLPDVEQDAISSLDRDGVWHWDPKVYVRSDWR